MKILICGAGRITDELLKWVSADWEITLIEKDKTKLPPFSTRFPSIVRLMDEDASSPVVLEKAGLREQDCVLVLTNDDAANLAIARFAREAHVKNILAVVRDPERLSDFHRLDVWTISMATDTARKAYQFLKDPRIRIVDLGEGEGELLELVVGEQDLPRLRDIVYRQGEQWRMVGILRGNKLLFPGNKLDIQADDRLLILGKSELYNTLAGRLIQNHPQFPRTYGQQMIVGIADDASLDVTELINEAFYLAQGILIKQIKVVHPQNATSIKNTLFRWSESLRIELFAEDRNINQRALSVARKNDAGLVVLSCKGRPFLRSFLGYDFKKMAKQLPCPLLIAKFTSPYERILVPFNGSLAGQRALEIAMDLGRQINAVVSAVIVVEPSYLHGRTSSNGQWENEMAKQVRELAHIHKTKVKEVVRHGNPVKEILNLAGEYQLLVMGSNAEDAGLFSVDVAGMLADQSTCSVMLV